MNEKPPAKPLTPAQRIARYRARQKVLGKRDSSRAFQNQHKRTARAKKPPGYIQPDPTECKIYSPDELDG